MRAASALTALRGAWGAVLLLTPRVALRVGHAGDEVGTRTAARVLGARHIAQSLWIASADGGVPPAWSVAVDVVHGSSMLVLAGALPRLRRAALVSAVTAGAFAAGSLRVATGAWAWRPGPARSHRRRRSP